MSILIVDDSIFIRESLRKILEAHDYDVVGEAEDGLIAVEQYKSLRPQLVLMDISMPNMDGIEAMKHIKQFDPSAKIIVFSSLNQKQFVNECLHAGALTFISKSAEKSILLDAIAKYISNSKKR